MCEKEREIIIKIKSLQISISKYGQKTTEFKKNNSIEKLETLNISSRQIDILNLVIMYGINNVSSLAKELDLSTSGLSIIISKMVKQDLLEKMYDDEDDGRMVNLVATKKGIDVHNTVINGIAEIIETFISSLDESEYRLYTKTCKDFTSAFEAFGVEPFDESLKGKELAHYVTKTVMTIKNPFEKFFREVNANNKEEIALTDKERALLGLIIDANICTPSEISKILCTSESTVSTQLRGLYKEGYLTKEKSFEDSRKTYFYPTKKGVETFEQCEQIFNNALIGLLQLSTEETLLKILEGLNSAIILFELLLK